MRDKLWDVARCYPQTYNYIRRPTMDKLVRKVAMDIREKTGADPVRINVEFDLSGLTREQLADWCVNASSLRVNYQNKIRPKGRAELVKLSKMEQKVVVKPCGVRSIEELSEEQMMGKLLERQLGTDYATYIEQFDTINEAFLTYFAKKQETTDDKDDQEEQE